MLVFLILVLISKVSSTPIPISTKRNVVYYWSEDEGLVSDRDCEYEYEYEKDPFVDRGQLVIPRPGPKVITFMEAPIYSETPYSALEPSGLTNRSDSSSPPPPFPDSTHSSDSSDQSDDTDGSSDSDEITGLNDSHPFSALNKTIRESYEEENDENINPFFDSKSALPHEYPQNFDNSTLPSEFSDEETPASLSLDEILLFYQHDRFNLRASSNTFTFLYFNISTSRNFMHLIRSPQIKDD